jgi:hypothetical protein
MSKFCLSYIGIFHEHTSLMRITKNTTLFQLIPAYPLIDRLLQLKSLHPIPSES